MCAAGIRAVRALDSFWFNFDNLVLASKSFSNHLTDHFNPIFDNYLAAFSKGFGCQTTLLRLAEDWNKDLDKQFYVGAVLMDMSKAFDCLPHDLIIAKLGAYGLSADACDFLSSYLTDRKQSVKLGQSKSSWLHILKGVPQGSIMGYFTRTSTSTGIGQ